MGHERSLADGVSLEMFKENREKLLGELLGVEATRRAASGERRRRQRSVIVLRGGEAPTRYDTDHEPVFRQESYFWWLTGVKEPDCWLVMSAEDGGGDDGGATASAKYRYVLLIPKLPPEYATIMGRIKTCEEWREHYGADEVIFTCQLEAYLEELAGVSLDAVQSTVYCKLNASDCFWMLTPPDGSSGVSNSW